MNGSTLNASLWFLVTALVIALITWQIKRAADSKKRK